MLSLSLSVSPPRKRNAPQHFLSIRCARTEPILNQSLNRSSGNSTSKKRSGDVSELLGKRVPNLERPIEFSNENFFFPGEPEIGRRRSIFFLSFSNQTDSTSKRTSKYRVLDFPYGFLSFSFFFFFFLTRRRSKSWNDKGKERFLRFQIPADQIQLPKNTEKGGFQARRLQCRTRKCRQATTTLPSGNFEIFLKAYTPVATIRPVQGDFANFRQRESDFTLFTFLLMQGNTAVGFCRFIQR